MQHNTCILTFHSIVIGQPNRVTGVEVVNNVLVWNAPASPGDTLQYQVRYRRVDDEDGRIITIEQPLHAYQFETLDPGNEYTVEVFIMITIIIAKL